MIFLAAKSLDVGVNVRSIVDVDSEMFSEEEGEYISAHVNSQLWILFVMMAVIMLLVIVKIGRIGMPTANQR